MPTTELPLFRLIGVVVAVGAMLVLAALASNTEQLWIEPPPDERIELPGPAEAQSVNTGGFDGEADPPPSESRPFPGWAAAAIMVCIAAILIYLAMQHAPRPKLPNLSRHRLGARAEEPMTDDEHDEEVIRVTTDLIDELSIEGDPRAAIQRAYAAVETGFGSRELARKPAETPLRYLERVFGRNLDQAGPLQQLTTLFEAARFSSAPVTENMRTQAIDSFAEIREHYRSRRRGRVR